MPIDADRISQDIEAIAAFNESTPDIGYSRPTFSPAWRAARDYVISEAEAAGCKTRIDPAGNVHARHASIAWDEKVWLSGSHIDSVPTGGKFDGVMGVVAPLEILRVASESGKVAPLELIIFAEEEGTTFGLGMIGSRLWTDRYGGTVQSVRKYQNRDRLDYFQAGAGHGVRVEDIEAEKLRPGAYHGFVEIHAEQGPAMWDEGTAIAVVTAIAGRMQFVVEYWGQANHAGSTSMRHRRDALVAAAGFILDVQGLAASMSPAAVATVGCIECEPNAINVIPGHVRMTVDVRSPNESDLLAQNVASIVRKEGFEERCLLTENMSPVPMDAALCAKLAAGTLPTTTSGALHDAAILAPLLPTAMIFVASKDGISHNPSEFSRIEDIAAAADVLRKLVSES